MRRDLVQGFYSGINIDLLDGLPWLILTHISLDTLSLNLTGGALITSGFLQGINYFLEKRAREEGKPKCQSSRCWLESCPYLHSRPQTCPLPSNVSLHLSRSGSSLSLATCCSWLVGTSLLYNTNKDVIYKDDAVYTYRDTYPREINANFIYFSRRDPCPRLTPYAECPAVSVRSTGPAGQDLVDWMGKYKLHSYRGEKQLAVYNKGDKFLFVSEDHQWVVGTGLDASNMVIFNPVNVSEGAGPVGLTGWKYLSQNDTGAGFKTDDELKVETSPGMCGRGEDHCCRLTREEVWEWDYRVRGRCMVLRPPRLKVQLHELLGVPQHELPTKEEEVSLKVGLFIIGITIVFVICYKMVTRTLDERRYRSLR